MDVLDIDSYSWVDSVDGGTGGARDNDVVDSSLSSPFIPDDSGTHDDVKGMFSAGLGLECTIMFQSIKVFQRFLDPHFLYIYTKTVYFLLPAFF